MAITTENSTQYARTVATPSKKVTVPDWHARLRFMFFEFAQGSSAGDAGSIARLIRLPAGRCRVILPLSRLSWTAMGSSRTMDLGWEAYTNEDGTAVVADPNGLDDGIDTSGAGNVIPGGTIGVHETKLFDSQDGVVITAQINDASLPAADTIDGWFAYGVD